VHAATDGPPGVIDAPGTAPGEVLARMANALTRLFS
jgi:hypothetical protein